ncbi:MAG: 3-oxoadipate enol-lactonase [Allorhizobium sp.]
MAFAEINGITVHYELIGDPDSKNLLVISNSLGTDFRIWLPLFDELGEDVSVLLYDSRGHGLTGLGDGPFTMDDLVDDLIALVDDLEIRKATFCGLSVGGLIVQGVWEKRPDLVKKIILCDTAAKIGDADTWNTRIDAIKQNGLASIGESVMQRWFTDAFHEDRPEDLAGYRLMLERQPVEGYVNTCAAIRDADFSASAPTITVPTLCIVGDQDGATPPALVRATADMIPGARFEVIEGCGHIPCVEQPEQLAALLQKFLKKG